MFSISVHEIVISSSGKCPADEDFGSNDDCFDLNPTKKCEKRAVKGKCNKKGMQKKCKKTCGLC